MLLFYAYNLGDPLFIIFREKSSCFHDKNFFNLGVILQVVILGVSIKMKYDKSLQLYVLRRLINIPSDSLVVATIRNQRFIRQNKYLYLVITLIWHNLNTLLLLEKGKSWYVMLFFYFTIIAIFTQHFIKQM